MRAESVMDGEDKENMADNSQSSQVSTEDVRAGYRSLIKDLVLAEDNILAAEAAAGAEGEGKITYDVFRAAGGGRGFPKSCSKLRHGSHVVFFRILSMWSLWLRAQWSGRLQKLEILADVIGECCDRRSWRRHWP